MKSLLSNKKNAFKWIMAGLFIFVVGGSGSIFMDRYLLPRMESSKFFGKIKFLKKASDNVTIINKTEQITVSEDDSMSQIASRAATAVVKIISINTGSSRIGTGVLATSDGVVVTYRDAIFEESGAYAVLLNNNGKYDAKLLGVDDFTNLAFLKIEASNLPSIDFANSDDFKPGRRMVAIGNSLGDFQNRFSAGLLSDVNQTFNLSAKSVAFSDKFEGVLEADIDNKQEYVGGPVISYGGDMVGLIGKAVIDNKEVYFEIPSNAVKKTMEKALNNELGSRPRLGLYYISITKEYALANNLKKDKGALVYSPSGKSSLAFIDGSPAQKAGLRVGDIIMSVNGKNIDLNNPLSNLVSQYNKGDKIELSVFRSDGDISVEVQL